MARAVLVLLVAMLAGCSWFKQNDRIPAQCDPQCFMACVDDNGDTGVRLDCDPELASCWDQIGELVTSTLPEKLRVCEVHRKACAQCLQRLDDEKVISL